MKHFAFIGTRDPSKEQREWMNTELEVLYKEAPGAILHTGACNGVDQMAANIWLVLGGNIALHLPWKGYEQGWINHLKQHYSGRGTIRVDGRNQEYEDIARAHHGRWSAVGRAAPLHARNVGIVKPCQRVYAAPGTKPWGGGTGMGIKIALHFGKELQLSDPLPGRRWSDCECGSPVTC